MTSTLALKKIREEIIESKVDDRYRLNAYEFVLNGLDFYMTIIGEKRHVTGQEFSQALLKFAHKQYGPMSKSVLNNWGITATEDFGCIVYNLIMIGLLSKQPQDSLDDFIDVVDFSAYFDQQPLFLIDPDSIKRVKGA